MEMEIIEEVSSGAHQQLHPAPHAPMEAAGWSSGGEVVAWEDLTVLLPSYGNEPTRRLLDGVTGFAEPGRITAIMGPSGSGKSTLLDALAGRLSRNVVMTGNVRLNGGKGKLGYGDVAYVTQEDILLGTLTVRETINYSAHLRLPSTLTNQEVDDIVQASILQMGLQDCADRLIGNWHLRGISGGERKRLSIALQILTRPHLLFLDEPTSGLDSASAFFVVEALRSFADDSSRRTVLSSIHQPSSEVFALFHDLILLSNGETVYFGEAQMAAKFFAEAGFPCPDRRNPSDHFLRCTNSDFDIVTETLMESNRICDSQNALDPITNLSTTEIKALLIRKYRNSEFAANAKSRIRELTSSDKVAVERQGGQAKWWKQLTTLTYRSSVNMSRDLGYYWLRIAIYAVLSICVGSVFFNVGTHYSSILARGACAGFISGFMTFMSIGGFPSFIEEMKVFYQERLNGHYGVGVYVISNFLSSFPFLTLMSLTSAVITYYMVKLRPGISHFTYICVDLVTCIAVVESCMMMIATLVPNYMLGVVIGSGYLGLMLLTSGYFRLLSDLPKVIWRYPVSYINFGAWGLQGAYKNDMIGNEFDSPIPGVKLKGEVILKQMLGVEVDHSKWWDIAAVTAILMAYRILFFAILKFKERASPYFRKLQTKRTLNYLKKRPSFRKLSTFSSKRHQPLRSLSSQEGLSSPIQ